jgi:cytochrome c oxidase subunit 1
MTAIAQVQTRPGAWYAVLAYIAVTGVVLLLLMLFGLLMRMAQAGWLPLEATLFYQLMTAHGIGMVGIAGIGGAAIMWHFLGQYVRLHTAVFVLNLVLFALGAVLILGAAFLGGFAGAWTFLYPLPAISGGVWSTNAAAIHLLALVLIGVGFLLLYLDVGWALIGKYGSLARALGWPQLFGGSTEEAPPTTVVASTMVTIINTLGLVSGATILLISLINLYVPAFAIDALVAKNMIYFFGHIFINATIYMSIIAVYEILPRYTGRPWKATRPFLAAWTASTIMVLAVYPHHLLMDFVMPSWALIVGQVVSYLSGLPVLVVTMLGALANVYRSGIRWDMASGLLFFSVFGWAAGVIPAIVDATIVVNSVMHNTMWVPGHFHFYLIMGVVAMALGFMTFAGNRQASAAPTGLEKAAFALFVAGGLGFSLNFLAAGRMGVPRRFAEHFPEWMMYGQSGSIFAVLVILGVTVVILRYFLHLKQAAAAIK